MFSQQLNKQARQGGDYYYYYYYYYYYHHHQQQQQQQQQQLVCAEVTTAMTMMKISIIIRINTTAAFLNRRALASIIPGREKFSWNLSF
jgi:hypothetical protein